MHCQSGSEVEEALRAIQQFLSSVQGTEAQDGLALYDGSDMRVDRAEVIAQLSFGWHDVPR